MQFTAKQKRLHRTSFVYRHNGDSSGIQKILLNGTHYTTLNISRKAIRRPASNSFNICIYMFLVQRQSAIHYTKTQSLCVIRKILDRNEDNSDLIIVIISKYSMLAYFS